MYITNTSNYVSDSNINHRTCDAFAKITQKPSIYIYYHKANTTDTEKFTAHFRSRTTTMYWRKQWFEINSPDIYTN